MMALRPLNSASESSQHFEYVSFKEEVESALGLLKFSRTDTTTNLVITKEENNGGDLVTLICDRNGNGGVVRKFILTKSVAESTSPVVRNIVTQQPTADGAYNLDHVPSSTAFENILKIVHLKGKWKFNGNFEDTLELVRAAHALRTGEVIRMVSTELQRTPLLENDEFINVHTAVQVLEASKFAGAAVLREASVSFICGNFQKMLKADQLNTMSCEILEEILWRDDLSPCNELQVFSAILSWGISTCMSQKRECNSKAMQEILGPLLPLIRFEQMSDFEYRHFVLPTKVLGDQLEQQMGVCRQDSVDQKNQSIGIRLQPRKYCPLPNQGGATSPALDIEKAEHYQIKYQSQMNACNYQYSLKQLDEKCRQLDQAKTDLVNLRRTLKDDAERVNAELNNLKLELQRSKQSCSGEQQKVPELTTELATRNRRITDLEGKVARLEQRLKKTDIDRLNDLKIDQLNDIKIDQCVQALSIPDGCIVAIANESASPMTNPRTFVEFFTGALYTSPAAIIPNGSLNVFSFAGETGGTCGLFTFKIAAQELCCAFEVGINRFALGWDNGFPKLDEKLWEEAFGSSWKNAKKSWAYADDGEIVVEDGRLRVSGTMSDDNKSVIRLHLSYIP